MSTIENYLQYIVNTLRVGKGKSSITKKKTIKNPGLIMNTDVDQLQRK